MDLNKIGVVKRVVILNIFIVGIPFFLFFIARHLEAQDKVKTGRLVIKYRNNIKTFEKEAIKRKIKARNSGVIPYLNVEVVKVQNRDFVIKTLKRDPRIDYVEPDYQAFIFYEPNDTYLDQQWALYNIKVASQDSLSGWNYSHGNRSVVIAVLDTGIDSTHPELSSKVIEEKNFSDSPTVLDLYGHGTHVAGIAAAYTNNNAGIAGVGYKASLANIKVLGDYGSGYYSWIANGVIWASNKGYDIINLSLGGYYDSQLLHDAIAYAWKNNILILAAAGNSGTKNPLYPAYYEEVIAVAAVDKDDRKASFSSFGRWVDVAAPGVNIYSTLPVYKSKMSSSGWYGYASGTSMATPHVAGLAALLKSVSNFSNNQMKIFIISGTDRIRGSGSWWKYGRINAYKTLKNAGARKIDDEISPTPTFLITPTSTPSATPTSTVAPTPTFTSTPTLTPIPTEIPSVTPTPDKPWWCKYIPRSRYCR